MAASKLIAAALLVLIPFRALADCDFSKGIEKLPDGRYAYSAECHKHVGKMVQDLKDKDTQLAAKDVQIKDLGVQLNVSNQSRQLWMDTALKLEDRVTQIEAMNSTNKTLYTGLGVVGTAVAVWLAGYLKH